MESDDDKGFLDYVRRSSGYLKQLGWSDEYRIGVYIRSAREELLRAFDSDDSGDYADIRKYVEDALELLEKALANQSSPQTMSDFGIKARLSLDRVFNPILRRLGRVEKERTYSTAEEREIARIFRRYGTLTWEELADILDVSESTARRRVEPFIERGEIRKLERKKGEKIELEWVK